MSRIKPWWVEIKWWAQSVVEMAWEAMRVGAVVTFMVFCGMAPLFALVMFVALLTGVRS